MADQNENSWTTGEDPCLTHVGIIGAGRFGTAVHEVPSQNLPVMRM